MKPYDALLQHHPFIDNVFAFKKQKGIAKIFERIRLIRLLRNRKYSLVIDQKNGTASMLLILFLNAKYRLCWSYFKWKIFYTLHADYNSVALYRPIKNLQLVKPLGIAETNCKLYITIEANDMQKATGWLKKRNIRQQNFICVSPGSKDIRKKWNLDNWVITCQKIYDEWGLPLVFVGAEYEYDDINYIISKCQGNFYMAENFSMLQSVALMKNSKALICNETAINHLSCATETPALCIIGPTDEKQWSPQGYFPLHYHLKNPNWIKNETNDFGITPREVVQKFNELMKEIEADNN
jgi:ADP-heptose:LPS heptosyltransferase